jgi:copper ion binding protein
MFGFEMTETVKLGVDGMSCVHCVKRVEDALKAVKGVKKAKVSLENKCADVTFVPAKVAIADLVKAVTDAGYSAKA